MHAKISRPSFGGEDSWAKMAWNLFRTRSWSQRKVRRTLTVARDKLTGFNSRTEKSFILRKRSIYFRNFICFQPIAFWWNLHWRSNGPHIAYETLFTSLMHHVFNHLACVLRFLEEIYFKPWHAYYVHSSKTHQDGDPNDNDTNSKGKTPSDGVAELLPYSHSNVELFIHTRASLERSGNPLTPYLCIPFTWLHSVCICFWSCLSVHCLY